MTYTYRIVNLNINGSTSATTLQLLEDFLRKQEVDIALLQEVTPGANVNYSGYHCYVNIETSARGTAILSKIELPLHDVRRIPSGRGIITQYEHIGILNVYAPSGSANRAEREEFSNTGIMDLLPHTLTELLMAGDFNCVLRTVTAQGSEHAAEHLEGWYKDSSCKMPGIRNKTGKPTSITPHTERRTSTGYI